MALISGVEGTGWEEACVERRGKSKINFMVGLAEHIARQVLFFRRGGKLGKRLRGAKLLQVHGRLRGVSMRMRRTKPCERPIRWSRQGRLP